MIPKASTCRNDTFYIGVVIEAGNLYFDSKLESGTSTAETRVIEICDWCLPDSCIPIEEASPFIC